MIEVEGLRKTYGDFVAVDGIDFRANSGQIFGLLGPNGAGKSTTISCISGLLKPTAGHVRVLGHDVVSEPVPARTALGVVPQELALYEDLPAADNLRFWGAAYGLSGQALDERVGHVLGYIGLGDRARDLPSKFSGGMKRRLNFGCGIVHAPKVLLLDEPTVGVDPQSRERLFEMVEEQRDAGACVLYTTHYMEEAERLCDELAIIDHGKLIAGGSLDELRRSVGERDVLKLTGHFPEGAAAAAASELRAQGMADLELLHEEEDSITLVLSGGSAHLPTIFSVLAGRGAVISETSLRQPSLETLFIKLTGTELRS